MHTEHSERTEHTEHKFYLFFFAFVTFVSQKSTWCFRRHCWVLESARQQYMFCVHKSSALCMLRVCLCTMCLWSGSIVSSSVPIMRGSCWRWTEQESPIRIFLFRTVYSSQSDIGWHLKEEDVREKQGQRKMDFRHLVLIFPLFHVVSNWNA